MELSILETDAGQNAKASSVDAKLLDFGLFYSVISLVPRAILFFLVRANLLIGRPDNFLLALIKGSRRGFYAFRIFRF